MEGLRAMSKVYESIVSVIQAGRLKEPFTSQEFEEACPGWAKGTYRAFLWKHRVKNPGGYIEYFKRISPGKFRVKKQAKD